MSSEYRTSAHRTYITHRVPSGENTSLNRHVLLFNPGITDGGQSKWPTQEQMVSTHLVRGKRDWYEVLKEDEGEFKNFLETVGNELAKKLGLIEEGEERSPSTSIFR